MVAAPEVQTTREPRWLRWWLGLLPAVYVISPLSVLALPRLRYLPGPALWVLALYAVSQQLPALLTPEPLLASVLTLTRTLLLFGLLGVGASLAGIRSVQVMAVGLVAVYATAAVTSLDSGVGSSIVRLGHPYMTPVAVGMAGTLGVWLAVFGGGARWWRIPLGLAALAVAVMSGSRGPLAALVVGCLLGAAVSLGRTRLVAVLASIAVLAGGLLLGREGGIPALARLHSGDTTGRDLVWADTLSVIQAHPWGGVGTYLLGKRLRPPGERCELWALGETPPAACPAVIEAIGSPWLIAHNVTLQQLAETGPLGLLGLFLLLGAVFWTALASRDGLALAVIGGLLVSTANDNTVLVPSPFFAEAFWVVSGTLLTRVRAVDARAGLTAAALMAGLSAPLLSTLIRERPTAPRLLLLSAPTVARAGEPYRVAAQFSATPGSYRAVLRSCTDGCIRLQVVPFTVTTAASPVVVFAAPVYAVGRQRLQLQLYPGGAGYHPGPLAQTEWVLRSPP